MQIIHENAQCNFSMIQDQLTSSGLLVTEVRLKKLELKKTDNDNSNSQCKVTMHNAHSLPDDGSKVVFEFFPDKLNFCRQIFQ